MPRLIGPDTVGTALGASYLYLSDQMHVAFAASLYTLGQVLARMRV